MNAFSIQVQDLVKVYQPSNWLRRKAADPVRAVDGLCFAVRPGQIFGLLGPNGAGKTTTIKMLTTLLRPTSGAASIAGFDVVHQPLQVRRRIVTVLQETAVELFLTVRENLLTFARFHGVPAAKAAQLAGETMERMRLTEEASRKVWDLSGGFKRRVQVAKIFMAQTPVAFLDEFSTGMDALLKRELVAALREQAAGGRTIVLTTQILSEAEQLCDDILIMNHGRQVARGDLQTLKQLSRGVYDITMSFQQLPAGMEAQIQALKPLRWRITRENVELTIRSAEADVMTALTRLGASGEVVHVEVNGASLEDIFVELMSNDSGAGGPERK